MDALEECRFIEASLSHISLEIEALFAEKVRLRRRLNTIRAKTSILPTETLAIIFRHAGREHRDMLHLGSVCSYWRNVIHTTPSLWSSVSLTYTGAKSVDILLYHRDRVKHVPLAVELFPGQGGVITREIISPLLSVLLTDITHNLRSLIFSRIDHVIWPAIESHASAESNFPQLKHLTLNFNAGSPCELKATKTMFASSRLSSIKLQFAMLGIEAVLPLENVECLDAQSMRSSLQGMRFLSRCPKIADFSWNDFGSQRADVGMTNWGSDVIVLHLKKLVWKGGNLVPAAGLIRRIQLPSLHQLDWAEFPMPSPPVQYAQCKRRFFSSMSNLQILHSSLNEETTVILSYFPSLEVLDLRCSNQGSLTDAFHNLIKELSWTGTSHLLPRLKTLTLHLLKIPEQELTAIIKMLESRRSSGLLDICALLEAFTLHVKFHDGPVVLEQNHVTALKGLAQGGLELAIWDDQPAPGRMLTI